MADLNRLELVKKYLACSHECPFCGSGNISGDSVEIESGVAYQLVSCNECERDWTDWYQLVGIKVIHDEKGKCVLDDASLDVRGILDAILNTPAVLPILKGLHPELDELIGDKLKEM